MSSVDRIKCFVLGQIKVHYGIMNGFYCPLIKVHLLVKSFTNKNAIIIHETKYKSTDTKEITH